MKIESKAGSFKVLQHKDDPTKVIILARHEYVLGRLAELCGAGGQITPTQSSINAFSMTLPKANLPVLMANLGGGVDYTNHGHMLMDSMPKPKVAYGITLVSPDESEDESNGGNSEWDESDPEMKN